MSSIIIKLVMMMKMMITIYQLTVNAWTLKHLNSKIINAISAYFILLHYQTIRVN